MKKFLLGILTIMLVACNAQGDIKGNTYVLQDSPEGLEITITFEAETNRFHGKAVNGYFGTYTIEGNNIKVLPIGSTMMAAPEPLMKAEYNYFQVLQNAKTIKVKGDTLTISNDDANLVFKKVEPEVEDEAEEEPIEGEINIAEETIEE